MITRSNTLSELEKLKTELEETKNELKETTNHSRKTFDELLDTEFELEETKSELNKTKNELNELKEKIKYKFHGYMDDIINHDHSWSFEIAGYHKHSTGTVTNATSKSNLNWLNRLYSDWCNYLDVDINCKVNSDKCIRPLNYADRPFWIQLPRDKDFSVLMKAAYKNKFELCEYLIEKGAVVDSDEYMESCGINKQKRDKLFKLDRICKLATDLYDKLPADKKNKTGSRKYYRQIFKDKLRTQGELHMTVKVSVVSDSDGLSLKLFDV